MGRSQRRRGQFGTLWIAAAKWVSLSQSSLPLSSNMCLSLSRLPEAARSVTHSCQSSPPARGVLHPSVLSHSPSHRRDPSTSECSGGSGAKRDEIVVNATDEAMRHALCSPAKSIRRARRGRGCSFWFDEPHLSAAAVPNSSTPASMFASWAPKVDTNYIQYSGPSTSDVRKPLCQLDCLNANKFKLLFYNFLNKKY